jgi:hypothetical protein
VAEFNLELAPPASVTLFPDVGQIRIVTAPSPDAAVQRYEFEWRTGSTWVAGGTIGLEEDQFGVPTGGVSEAFLTAPTFAPHYVRVRAIAAGRSSPWVEAGPVAPQGLQDTTFATLVEPPDRAQVQITDAPGGAVLAYASGEWWRRTSNNKRISWKARIIADAEADDYQIDGAQLTLNEVLGTTRASVGTYLDEAGTVLTAPANVLRRDFVAAQGVWTILTEAAATNHFTWSEDFAHSDWVKTQCTVTADNAFAPDGSGNADLITSNNSGPQGIYQDFATDTAEQVWVFSAWVRLNTMAPSAYLMAFRNNTAGTFIAQNVAPSDVPTSTGWTRITHTFTKPAGCTSLRIQPWRNSAAVPGSFWIWGAQAELDFASTYIKTEAAQVTRPADAPFFRGVTATLDVSFVNASGASANYPGESVFPGYWMPVTGPRRYRRIIARRP